MSLVRIDAQIRCPFCHDSIKAAPRTGCSECLAWHHTACLAEHGACSTCAAPYALGATAPATATDVSEVLAQVCQAQGCFSVETLDRPGRPKRCSTHARSDLAGITIAGVLILCVGVALTAVMIQCANEGDPGPWPLMSLPALFSCLFGVVALYRQPGEMSAIREAEARAREAAAPSSSPPVIEVEIEARPRAPKVVS